MTQPDSPIENPSVAIHYQENSTHWPSVLQFVFSTLAIIGLWGFALLSFALGMTDGAQGIGSLDNTLSLFLISAIAFAGGLLVIPSSALSLRRITGRRVTSYPRILAWIRPGLIIFLFPLVLLLGHLVITYTNYSWLLLPALHVLAILIPISWLLSLLVRGLPLGSHQRSWGVFDSGLVLGPLLVLLAELLAIAAFITFALVYVFNQPGLYDEIMSLMDELSTVAPSSETIIQLLAPYLASPWMLFAVLAFAAVVVPLIEEAIKPIGVWLLVGRDLSPAEGFAAGALSGAGFALFESLMITSGGTDWAISVVVRISTAIIHMFTASLMGWALVTAWGQKRYLKLGITYLGVVLLHGTWNGLTLAMTANDLLPQFGQSPNSPILSIIGTLTPYILGTITIILLIAILQTNRHFRNAGNGDTRVDQNSQNNTGIV